MTKKRILVTGGSGLVGSAISSLYYDSSYDFVFVSSKQYDLLSFDQCKKMFSEYKPEIVIHLAACVGGLFKNMNQKVRMFEDNIMMNFNVVKCAYESGVEKLVACLSTCIFPDLTTYPICEEMLHNGSPHSSNDCYAYAKRMLEVQCRAYRENFGANFVCVIPTNIYGEHDNFSLTDGHVIPALIRKCYIAKETGEPFVVCGTGRPLRQFIYSSDLAKLIMWVVENFDGDLLILSPEEEVSIHKVALEIAWSFGMENQIIFDDSFSDGQYKKTADNRKLMGLLGNEFKPTQNLIHSVDSHSSQSMTDKEIIPSPEGTDLSIQRFKFTPIQEGIPRVCKWFRDAINDPTISIRL